MNTMPAYKGWRPPQCRYLLPTAVGRALSSPKALPSFADHDAPITRSRDVPSRYYSPTVSRGEQGRPEDAAAEAAETGTAAPGRSLPAASIPEHPLIVQQGARQDGIVPGAADMSTLAGADVILVHGDSPQSAHRDLPPASTGKLVDPAAGAGSSARLSGLDPSLAAAIPGAGADDAAAGRVGGRTAADGRDRSVLPGAPDAAAASIRAADAGGDLRSSVTLNPLFEPEAADDSLLLQAASIGEPSAEPAIQADSVQARAAASGADGAPGAVQSSGDTGESSGNVRVRHRGSEAHPSILRLSTWTDSDTAVTGDAAE